MNFSEACEYIASLRQFEKRPTSGGVRGGLAPLAHGGLDFTGVGLRRAARLYELLGNPQSRLRVVHVGGTSGKGSTALFVHGICAAAGLRAGLYTSPALSSPLDRTRINGQIISDEAWARLVTQMQPAIEKMKSDEFGFGAPSEFEISVGLAFLYFAEERVDVAVIEVGVGGLIDATNVVDSCVSVITNVSLAHTRILGRTIEHIASNKAGIIKRGQIACVTASDDAVSLEDAAALRVISGACNIAQVPLCRVRSSNLSIQRLDEMGSHFSYTTSRGCKFDSLHVRMVGDAQITNACCAIEVVDALRRSGEFGGFDGLGGFGKVSDQVIAAGLSSSQLEGRLELVRVRTLGAGAIDGAVGAHEQPRILLDGAHNNAKAAFLARTLCDVYSHRRLILVFGVKKYIVRHFTPLASVIIVCEPVLSAVRGLHGFRGHRVATAEEIVDVARAAGFKGDIIIVKNPVEAVEKARALARADDLICVTGSLHLVGMVRDALLFLPR